MNNLPEAAFAIPNHFEHHTDAVSKPTENKTVDMDMLRTALAAVNKSELPQADKDTALDHLKAHALALDIDDAEVAELIGESAAAPDYATCIADATSFVEAENLLAQLIDANADDELVSLAHRRMIDFAKEDRESLVDRYDGSLVDAPTQSEDGLWHFTARVAQADKINLNKRIYPKAEFEKNLPRVNRLCKAGRFTGRDGHASWLSDDKPSEICVRYDAVSMQGDDLIMEGVLVPTQAGENIATLWANKVQTEWSIVGYGKGQYTYDDDGNLIQVTIFDYVLDGCDPVRRGAADTKILQVSQPKDDAAKDAIADKQIAGPSPEEVQMDKETKDKEIKVEEAVVAEPKAPEIDMDELKAQIKADAAEATKSMVAEAVKAAQAEVVLENAKVAAIAKLAEGEERIAKIVSLHFAECKTVEDVATVVETVTPLVEGMFKVKHVETVGIHAKSERESGFFTGQKMVDRPETISGVREALMDGIEDNGRQDPSNMAYNFRVVLDNYEKAYPQYFAACTRRGYAETATTTTALGTQLPQVLPLIRRIFPQLIPYTIQSVQPISTPTARVHYLDFKYASGTSDGSDMDDTSQFDTSWADHAVEGSSKSQIGLAFTHADLTAKDKSIFYNVSSNLVQDMQALQGLDAEAELLNAAAGEIARELNFSYLEMIAAAVGTDVDTFGLVKPATWLSQETWLSQGLSLHVNKAMSRISENFGAAGRMWAFTTPAIKSMFAATNKWEATGNTDQTSNQFGFGIVKEGTYDGALDIYSVAWGKTLPHVKNKMVFGFYPQEWMYSGSVYAPYIPLYLSPADGSAEHNTLSRSLTNRSAQKVLQPLAFSALTLANEQGTDINFLD